MRKAGAPRVRVRWGRKHTGVEYRLCRARHLIAINTKRFIIKLGQLPWKRALERFLLQNSHHLGPQAPSSGYRSDSTWRKPARQSHHPVGPSQVVCYALFCTTDARVAPLALSHSHGKGGLSGGSRRPPVLCCPQDRQTTVDGNLLHSERVHRPCFLLHDGPCVPPFPPPMQRRLVQVMIHSSIDFLDPTTSTPPSNGLGGLQRDQCHEPGRVLSNSPPQATPSCLGKKKCISIRPT
jgi:hypothetical protein